MQKRPLSPHLQIYHPALTMLMSIAHRASGIFLYIGSAGLSLWLAALAYGESAYAIARAIALAPIGQILLFLFIWALLHHALGGVRHLIWDTGLGFAPKSADLLAWATLIGGIALTLALWTAAGRAPL